jgi:F-type H+-transporting ATPase subunit epsilon
MAVFRLRLLSPEKNFFDGEATEVVFSTPEGRMGVMAGHAPAIASVAEGIIEILAGGVWKIAAVSQGFAEISFEKADFYLDTAEWAEDIDVLRAAEALKRAEQRFRSTTSQLEQVRTQAAMSRALARLRAANLR